MSNITSQEAKQIAEEAYIFSFPMLMGYRYAFATFLTPSLPSYRGPVNIMHGKAATLDHTFKDVVTPNADTPYSMAMLDLRAEPVVIHVPPVTDRYYVLQFEDLFGTNPHYVGSRSTGSQSGAYLAVGPRWEGDTSGDFDDVLPFDTDLVFVIGRTQLLGPNDVPILAKIMEAYNVQTLSSHRSQASPPAQPVEWPVWDDAASRDERFISYVNFLLSFCQPTHPSEEELMARFAQIAIGPGLPFDAEALSPEVREALRAGVDSARKTISTNLENLGQIINGWMSTEVFGDRKWYRGDYLLRATGAMAGWGGNDAVEAIYPMARQDSNGRSFDGSHGYQITFTTLPPAKAFWSVTIYDTSYDGTAGYLVENPINRYLTNSTTQGLVSGSDGSLTITIQRQQPQDPHQQANWLPAPEETFYLVLRIYWPEQAALQGDWTPPPVVRID